jgi:phosphoserine phosphatase
MNAVMTLIAAPDHLTAAAVEDAKAALTAAGAEVGAADWLSVGEAVDLPFANLELDAAQAAVTGPFDVVVQPVNGRRKQLLVADMDSTIVTEETLDELADFAGFKEKVAAITMRAMNGELDFEAAIDERVGLLAGLDEEMLQKTWERIEYTPGAQTLVATMRAHGAKAALVSGGFDFFTGKVRAALGFDYDQANVLLTENGKLTGKVQKPVLDKMAKVTALNGYVAELGLSVADAITVGDGANDLPMLNLAGTGVAYHAKPSVRAEAKVQVNHGDLMALLFIQGFRREEFV